MSADREDPGFRDRGLEQRFKVERLIPSSRGIDHSECQYFVLDPAHDPLARSCLIGYAMAAAEDGQQALADDLLAWVSRLEAEARAADVEAQLHQMQVEKDYGIHGTGAGEAAKW